MKSGTCFKTVFLALFVLGNLPGLVLAQTPISGNVVSMTSDCAGGDVVLSIHFDSNEAPPANIVGWRVERLVMGSCDAASYANELQPWPALGESDLTLTVTPLHPDRDEVYRIWAIDDAGDQVYISWGQRRNYTHAECLGGPSTIGYVVMLGDYPFFEPCPENCWWGLSFFDTALPEDLVELVDSGTLVDIHGEFHRGMEGDYIESGEITWNLSNEYCGVVSTRERSWDTLKSMYR